MIKLGTIDGREFRVVKVEKINDGSGFNVELMDHNSIGENLTTVGKVFLPSKQAKTIAEIFLGETTKKDIKNSD